MMLSERMIDLLGRSETDVEDSIPTLAKRLLRQGAVPSGVVFCRCLEKCGRGSKLDVSLDILEIKLMEPKRGASHGEEGSEGLPATAGVDTNFVLVHRQRQK